MIQPAPSEALTLQQHADDIATAACERLLRDWPEIGERFGDDAEHVWKRHLNQRVLELSAAVEAGQPGLFGSRLNWSRNAMAVRNLKSEDLDASLNSLRDGIEAVLSGSAQQAAVACIDSARAGIASNGSALSQSYLDPALPEERLAQQYIQTVIAGNVLQGLDTVLDALSDGLNVRNAFLKVLLPAQREVGRLWHQNEVSVAEEHLVTSTTLRLMAVLASRANRAKDRGQTAIAAAVAGNAHEVGIRAITYLMELDGWRAIYLGQDMPKTDLPAMIEAYDADLVLLSLALSSQLPSLQKSIVEIRRRCGDAVKIMIGGNGLRGAPELWKDVDADGYAPDAEKALDLAAELLVPAE